MRPQLGWSDLAGARVGVWGLGVEGRANLRKLRSMGVEPVLVDDRGDQAAAPGEVVLPTADGGLEELGACDAVVKSPGISRRRPEAALLTDGGVPVLGGLGLWLFEAPLERVACITGTKGKSTTTSIAGHLLGRLARTVLVGGNIGRPPYDPESPQDVELWVIEVSSYQATDLPVSPPVTAVTSLDADHLDWHGSLEAYHRDKLSMTSQPGARLTIASGESEALRARRALLGPQVQWVTAADGAGWSDSLGLLGRHNRTNAAVARAVLAALGVAEAADDEAMAQAGAGFEGLAHRLQVVRVLDGVRFVDDSLSTNVLPTVAALDAFGGERVALLVGGFDRGIDYEPLALHLAAREEPTLVLTMPDSGARIAAALAPVAHAGPLEVIPCDDLDEAVNLGFSWARPGGVVLLSPAAPSFGRFTDYTDRARAFADAADRCAAG